MKSMALKSMCKKERKSTPAPNPKHAKYKILPFDIGFYRIICG